MTPDLRATKGSPSGELFSRKSPIARRNLLRAWVALAITSVVLVAAPALAGSYLDRSHLIVEQANQEARFLQYRLSDRELSRVVHEMAAARVEAARRMHVPEEVRQAHPHLLLMLENYERAAHAAEDGEAQRFIVYQRRARDEEQIFRGILTQLGFPLRD